MGTINKFNSVQFESVNVVELNGVTLIYESINRDGVTKQSAINFSGDEYCPINNSQDEVFRVWKNIVATFWKVKAVEAGLKVDNGGIASKLRAGTPATIIVHCKDGDKPYRCIDVESSVWSRIGLVPTKKDMEACARDFKKKIHAAAKASFDALSFRLNFAEIANLSVPEPKNQPSNAKTKAKTTKVA